MKAKKVEKDEGMDLTDWPGTKGNYYTALNVATKPKRRNGRLAWKPRALQAEKEVSMYYWMGLVMSVIAFLVGINVGLYAF